eukprot:NODE_617_length_5364_cov_0.787654.p4 type:complete len:190 gc:universal NODE_617_length_5364_cov_0.787654:2672-3241(+)
MFLLQGQFILGYVAGISLIFNIQYGLLCLLNIHLLGKTRINVVMFILTFFMIFSNFSVMMRPNLFEEPVYFVLFEIGTTLESVIITAYTPIKFRGLLPKWMKFLSFLCISLIATTGACLSSSYSLAYMDYIEIAYIIGCMIQGIIILFWCQKLYLKIFKNQGGKRDVKQQRLRQISIMTTIVTFFSSVI